MKELHCQGHRFSLFNSRFVYGVEGGNKDAVPKAPEKVIKMEGLDLTKEGMDKMAREEAARNMAELETGIALANLKKMEKPLSVDTNRPHRPSETPDAVAKVEKKKQPPTKMATRKE